MSFSLSFRSISCASLILLRFDVDHCLAGEDWWRPSWWGKGDWGKGLVSKLLFEGVVVASVGRLTFRWLPPQARHWEDKIISLDKTLSKSWLSPILRHSPEQSERVHDAGDWGRRDWSKAADQRFPCVACIFDYMGGSLHGP